MEHAAIDLGQDLPVLQVPDALLDGPSDRSQLVVECLAMGNQLAAIGALSLLVGDDCFGALVGWRRSILIALTDVDQQTHHDSCRPYGVG